METLVETERQRIFEVPGCGEDGPPEVEALSPRAERKCAQLLDGARSVILARGFDGASVDDIAREAGVSKATMYRYYSDKAAIFAAVMRRDCANQSDVLLGIEAEGRPLVEILTSLAERYMTFVTSPPAQSMFRVAVAESERFAEVGQAFYASGVDRVRAWLSPVIAAAATRGEVAVEDPDVAAHRFLALCQAELFFKKLFGISDCCQKVVAARAADTAAAFMRMYRPD